MEAAMEGATEGMVGTEAMEGMVAMADMELIVEEVMDQDRMEGRRVGAGAGDFPYIISMIPIVYTLKTRTDTARHSRKI